MDVKTAVARLKLLADPESAEGMARVGIQPDKALGVKIPRLRALAREIGRNHELALKLWAVDMRETRILASMIADPRQTDEALMEAWALDFWDWEVCDQCCANLFEKTALAWDKSLSWSGREEEFVKRAGFVLMARLAVSDKKAGDEAFIPFLPLIEREAVDSRNMVKKAVNWALRQIGKRNPALNARAVQTAEAVGRKESRSARWIASDALRELQRDSVKARLQKKKTGSHGR